MNEVGLSCVVKGVCLLFKVIYYSDYFSCFELRVV